ncbi:S8 family serine peptidase [Flammeovirga sp. EKP202]|uniref:S8 family serine peptidase n=1 Tax=Flammeovirga sp. EKP202 TaxID=2770592 RepID=UPI00165FE2A9|nr:S8 family serine peptidase [Flammeovirga sp. EKP202]MBD0400794.1 S8 family serine peptidase [Flammeovirga sp. EKP202]
MKNSIILLSILLWGWTSLLYAQTSEVEVEEGVIRMKFTSEIAQTFRTIELPSTDSRVNLTGVTAIDNFNNNQNIKSFKRVFPFSLQHEEKHRKHNLHLWYEVTFDKNISPMQMVQNYKQLGGTQIVKPVYKKSYIEPNQKFIPAEMNSNQRTQSFTFNDPLIDQQWHYENDGTRVGEEDADIDLAEAWKTTTGTPNVVVAIVDGGIDTNHDDIKGALWVNEAELNGEPGVDDDQNGYVDDINGYNFVAGGNVSATDHGTHVGGTVGARSNNGIGVAGVAGGDGTAESGARLMSCQIFLQAGASSGAENAYVYAADNGAVIAQSSWSYNSVGFYEEEVMDAIDYFVAEAGHYEGSPMKGGIVFFSAGNTGAHQLIYPSAHENVTAVAASDPFHMPTQYTTHGEWVDILAPGGATYEQEIEGVLSTVPGNNYAYFQGTSMACPHVSGVAALVLSEFGHKDFTPEELRQRIVDFSAPFHPDMHEYWNGLVGKGILNAVNSLSVNNGDAPEEVILQAENVLHNEFDVTWNVPRDPDDGEPAYFYVWFSDLPLTEDNYQNLQPYVFENNLKEGDQFTLSIGNTREGLDFYFAAVAQDKWGNTSELSNILKVTTAEAPRLVLAQDSIFLTVDVSKQTSLETSLFIENTKGGTLKWDAFAKNYGYIPEEDLEEPTQDGSNGLASISYDEKGLPTLNLHLPTKEKQIGYASPNSNLTTNIAVQNIQREDHFYNYPQITDYRAGLFYDRDEWPTEALGPETAKTVNFVHATRFEITSDYSFNLTHVGAFSYITNTTEPIIVEIRKGEPDAPTNATTIHTQEFTPTEEGLGWIEIPLTKNFRFEDSEVFWVVMHHPLGEEFPITSNRDYTGNPGRMFWISKNGGRTFEDVQNLSGGIWYYLLKVRALSTGNDGAWAYVDPVSGEVGPYQSSTPALKLDPSSLVNGSHKTAVGFYTNDPNYPAATIFVDLTVTGQQPELDYPSINALQNTFTNVLGRHSIDIKNTGFGDLVIYDGSTEIEGLEVNISDTVRVDYNETYSLPLHYTPASLGMQQGYVTLNTNIGELQLLITANVADPAVLTVSEEKIVLEQEFDEAPFSTTFTIKNDGDYPLEYRIPTDLFEKYTANHNELRELFENGWYPSGNRDGKPRNVESIYTYITSDEEDGPIAGTFTDISKTGTSIRHLTIGFLNADNIPVGFKFPFFDGTYDHININPDGVVGFGKIWTGGMSKDLSFPYTNTSEASIALLWKNFDPMYDYRNQEWGGDIFYETKGDQFIIQYDNIKSLSQEGRMTLQVVLFKNGDFELRYKDIEKADWYNQALVGIQNMEEDYGITIQSSSANKREYDFVSPLKDELIIRFQRHEDAPFIVEATPKAGLLLPGEEQEITLEIDAQAFRLYDGLHLNKLFIFNNGVDEIAELDIELTIAGELNLELEKSEITFDPLIENQTASDSIVFENTGSKAVEIVAISDLEHFEFTTQLPYPINPESRNVLEINYTPLTSGSHTEEFIITLSNGEEYTIQLKGNAYENPSPLLSQASFEVELEAKSSSTKSFTLTNQSSDHELWYTLQPKGQVQSLDLDYTSVSLFDTLSFLYGVTDTQEDAQPMLNYTWENIVSPENKIEVQTDAYYEIELPFAFMFYGEEYEKVWMNEHGFLTVVEPEVSTSNTYSIFEKDDSQKGMIAPLWALFEPNPSIPTAGLYYKTYEDYAVFEWYDMTSQFGFAMPGSATFQAVLFKTGQFEFRYNKVDNFDGEFNFGIESPDEKYVQDLGRAGVDWEQIFGEDFNDDRSILFTPPSKGTLQPNASKEFTLLFDAQNLYDGTYIDTVYVLSNSAKADSIIRVPVTFKVNGAPAPQIDETLALGTIYYVENVVTTDTLFINNTGTKHFEIDSLMYDSEADFEITTISGGTIQRNKDGRVYTKLEIPAKGQLPLLIHYTPQGLETLSENITVVADNGYRQTTQLTAEVVKAPSISVSTTDTTFQSNLIDLITAQFSVFNKGVSDLEYEAEVIYKLKEGQELPELKEDETLTFADSVVSEHINNTVAAGYWASLGGAPTSVASKMKSPKGGFMMTHVKSNVNYIHEAMYSVRVEVYIGGDEPLESNLLHSEDIEFQSIYGHTWMLWELGQSVFIPENTDFWLVIHHPPLYFQVGFEFDYSDDYKFEDNLVSFNQGEEWGFDPLNPRLWKSRALSQTANEGWLSLDQHQGTVKQNQSLAFNASVNNEFLGNGDQWAIIRLKSNDPIEPETDINFYVNTNKAPNFEYVPVSEDESITLYEGSDSTFNFIITDPEGDALTYTLDSTIDFGVIHPIDEKVVQLTFSPDYEDEGQYEVRFTATDEFGAEKSVQIPVEVMNSNRVPEVIQIDDIFLNAYREELELINITDIVYDLDEDQLGVFVQNFNPDLIELAYGDDEVIIIPKEEGIALIAYGADDFNGGFSYKFAYVVVEGSVTGTEGELEYTIKTFPNPANNVSNIQMDLMKSSQVEIQLFNLQGQKVKEIYRDTLPTGTHLISTDVNQLNSGIYLYRLMIDAQQKESIKLIVE